MNNSTADVFCREVGSSALVSVCELVTTTTTGDASKRSCPCKYITIGSSIWTAAITNDLNSVLARLHRRPESLSRLDDYGYSALHYAAQKNHVEIVKLLLRKGLKPDLNACGATPLHRAAFSGSLESCRLLIESGASVNCKDSSFGDMMTPYQKAGSNGHTHVQQLLLEFGAEPRDIVPIELPLDTVISHTITEPSSGDEIIDSSSIYNLSELSASTSTTLEPEKNKSPITPEITEMGFPCSKCGVRALVLSRNSRGQVICGTCKSKRSVLFR